MSPAGSGAPAAPIQNPQGEWKSGLRHSATLIYTAFGVFSLLLALTGLALILKAAAGQASLGMLLRNLVGKTESGHLPSTFAQEEGFNFRRHWGGFGGDSAGWYLSTRLARLLMGTTLLMLGISLLLYLLEFAQ